MAKTFGLAEQSRDTGPAPVFARVAIIGFGLIGASVALATKRKWPSSLVIAVDRKPVIEAAMRVHAADVGADGLFVISDADLIILATPVLETLRLLDQLPEYARAGALVTDVGSTKRLIVAAAEGIPSLSFVGGHPMAGAAHGGLAQARADLFDGRPWILTPRRDHAESLENLQTFVAGLGASPHIMAADLHDRFVGAVSHLPQLTASALMHVVGRLAGDAGLELAGAGLRDTTRLASSPADIWRDIAATNEDVLRDALDLMIRTLTELRDTLDTGETLETVFTSAARWREALLRARGEKPQ